MDHPSSPLETLRQLREMLDAGTLTPAEFEALKAKLVFGPAPPADATPLPPVPATPAAPTEPSAATPPATPIEPANYAASEPAPPVPPAAAPVLPAAEPAGAAATDGLHIDDAEPAADASAGPEPRSYLNLILALGGLLALLAVVLYLNLNPRDSEHISSASQTAADTLAAPVEEGPQAEQPTLVESVPETIRVAPTNPAPPIVRPALPARDSLAQLPADSLP